MGSKENLRQVGPVLVPARCPDTDCPVWREFSALRDHHGQILRTLHWIAVGCVAAGVAVWLMCNEER